MSQESSNVTEQANMAYCHAILAFLTSGLEEVVKVYTSLLAKISETNVLHELLTQDFVELYEKIVKEQPFRPSDFREILENALKLHPANTALWETYGWNEDKLKIENRLKRTFDEILSR